MPPATTTAPATERRLRFASVAEQYERARPGYPEGLVDVVLDYGLLAPGDRALDVGAGNGQATVQFAGRGLSVLAVDPSVEMTEIANRRFTQAGLDARAIAGDFESVELEEDAFSLIYAATSWHWLDPAVRFQIAARAIAPDGTLAVFWTWPRWRRTALRDELDEVYASSGAPLAEMGPLVPHEPDPDALIAEWVRETRAGTAFGDPEARLFRWSVTYSATGYTDLLGTYADHIGLHPEVREPLLHGIERTIERAGATIELPYATLLLLARAA